MTFAMLDGIITDCSSFLIEYLYTKSKGCYLLKNEQITDFIFTEFGKKCLNEYFIAYNKEHVISYLDKINTNGNDINESDFINQIKHNHGNVGKKIVDYIENKIRNINV